VNYGRKRVRGARIANERRGSAPANPGYIWLAARAADKRNSETTLALRRFVENGARLTHDPIAEAKELQRVSAVLNLPLAKLAEARGESEQSVLNKLGLALLAPEIQEKISSGEIAKSVGYQLAKLPDHDAQRKALVAAGTSNVADVKKAVRASNPNARTRGKLPPTNAPNAPAPAESKPKKPGEAKPAAKPVESKPSKPAADRPTTAEIREMIAMLGGHGPGAAALRWVLGEASPDAVLATPPMPAPAMAV
jgi:hypothetical protein